jgi:hypothetical protein
MGLWEILFTVIGMAIIVYGVAYISGRGWYRAKSEETKRTLNELTRGEENETR